MEMLLTLQVSSTFCIQPLGSVPLKFFSPIKCDFLPSDDMGLLNSDLLGGLSSSFSSLSTGGTLNNGSVDTKNHSNLLDDAFSSGKLISFLSALCFASMCVSMGICETVFAEDKFHAYAIMHA